MNRTGPAEGGDTAPSHTLPGRMFYDTLWVLCRTLGVALFGIRYRLAEPIPPTGGLLVLATHQSHLDPLLLGLVCERRLSYLARSSLFGWAPFAAMISALDAVPIDRAASSVTAMKTVIRKLRGGAALTIYPEGTRTSDGRVGEVKNGFALVAKRSGVPILPVAIVGAWQCWPRSQWLPLPGRIRLEFGSIIPAAEVAAMDERALVALVTQRLTELDTEARRVWSGGSPKPSPRRVALMAAKSAGRRRARTEESPDREGSTPRNLPPTVTTAAADSPLPREAAPTEAPSPPPPPA